MLQVNSLFGHQSLVTGISDNLRHFYAEKHSTGECVISAFVNPYTQSYLNRSTANVVAAYDVLTSAIEDYQRLHRSILAEDQYVCELKDQTYAWLSYAGAPDGPADELIIESAAPFLDQQGRPNLAGIQAAGDHVYMAFKSDIHRDMETMRLMRQHLPNQQRCEIHGQSLMDQLSLYLTRHGFGQQPQQNRGQVYASGH